VRPQALGTKGLVSTAIPNPEKGKKRQITLTTVLIHNIRAQGFRLAISYKKKADGIKVPSAFLFLLIETFPLYLIIN